MLHLVFKNIISESKVGTYIIIFYTHNDIFKFNVFGKSIQPTVMLIVK